MTSGQNIKEKIGKIYQVLPKLDCGRCGYTTCGQFARAVAEDRASPYDCVGGGYYVAYRVSEIAGVKLPAFTYGAYQIPLVARTRVPVSARLLKEEVEGLHREIDDILNRLENLSRCLEALK